MFSQLVISALILSSVVAVAPPEDPAPEEHEPLSHSSQLILKATGELENGVAVASMTNFRCTFIGYEKRVKTFLENIKIKEQSLRNAESETFLDQLRTYVDMLPKNETREVTKRSRETCVCDDRHVSPCPERCIYSCYAYKPNYGHRYWTDCKKIEDEISECYCYSGSSSRCDDRALSNCYEEKTELEEVIPPCSQYAIPQTLLEKPYSRFVELLIEPLRKQVRGLGYKLSSFKQSVIATDLLFNFTHSLCDEQNETPCFLEASNILNQKLTKFLQLKRNITMDMIRLQESVETVSSNVAKLKEQTLSQVQKMIKSYACCLKGLDFSVEDNECEAEPPALFLPLLPPPPPRNILCPPSSFQCDNRQCVPESAHCDGADDCGDMSDEANC